MGPVIPVLQVSFLGAPWLDGLLGVALVLVLHNAIGRRPGARWLGVGVVALYAVALGLPWESALSPPLQALAELFAGLPSAVRAA
jgi:hypothetical protein